MQMIVGVNGSGREPTVCGWRMSCEFVDCLYNVVLRRSQLRAVQMYVVGPQAALSEADAEALQEVTAHDFVATAIASGDCDNVRAALRRKDLDHKVEVALRQLERTQRKVPGSEAEKDAMRPRFTAMRVWGGCESIFFTLNHIRHRQPSDGSLGEP